MTTWSYDSVPLSTFGKITLIDEDLDIPEKRGNNIVIPFRHGTSDVIKYYGERKMTFGIAMKAASALLLESNIDTLKALISSRSSKTLSQTREDTSVRTIQAKVETPLQIKRESAKFARLVLEFTCPFPFFRLSTAIASNETTINASPKAMTVTNPGTAEEIDPTIILTGPLQNTVITNPVNNTIFTYTGTIASPRIVTIQTSNGVLVAADDLGANRISNISHQGASSALVINAGSNPLSITDDTHTTGKVKITFNAPYL